MRVIYVALLIGSMHAPASAVPFCQRIADKLGLKYVDASQGGGERWERYLLNPAQRLLVGGRTPPIAYSVLSLDSGFSSTLSACKTTKKTNICSLVGPVKYYIALGEQEATEELPAGESATIDTPGLRLRCRTGLYPAK